MYTDKEKIKFSSDIRKFRLEQLQSHTYMTNGLLIYGEIISSYIRKPFLIYDFATAPLRISLYICIWGKFDFLFYQCTVQLFSVTTCTFYSLSKNLVTKSRKKYTYITCWHRKRQAYQTGSDRCKYMVSCNTDIYIGGGVTGGGGVGGGGGEKTFTNSTF